MSRWPGSSVRDDGRGQSEVVGFMLVFAIVLAGAIFIVVLGASAIDSTEESLTDDRAETTMTQFASSAALVALEETDQQRVGFPADAGEQFRVDDDRGLMIVTIENRSADYTEEIMNLTMGAVTYEGSDGTVAYQGGGVWKGDGDGGSMISPPEFHYRNGTLTLPAISVGGDTDLGSEAVIEQGGTSAVFPDATVDNRTNPLERHQVDVTVKSQFYRGWGQYFADRTDGDVEYDHDNETVTVTLVSPVDIDEVTAASASLSAGGEFHVSGTSASDCDGAGDVFTDSYNSSQGTYCEQFDDGPSGMNGDVVYGEDIDISDGTGGSNFYGDIASGGTVTVDDSEGAGQPSVYGNISYVDECIADEDEGAESCEDRIHDDSDGEVRQIDGIGLTESVDWFIQTTIEDIREHADETNPAIEGETLHAGEYYMDNLSVDTHLELNTTEGDVFIAVERDISLAEGAEIEVTGEGHAELFILGDGVDDKHLTLENEAAIFNTDNNATRFRLFGTADMDARLGGGGSGNLARFDGVIYAPPGSEGTGSVELDGAEVFGGILTGTTNIEGGSIHYDEALEGETIVPEEARVIRVTFLHVTENHLEIGGR